MNDFDYYLGEGLVKKQKPGKELARSLISDADERFKNVVKLDIKVFSKIIFENVYEALREVLDALLAVDGYKSYSHEASIAYLKRYKFEDSVLLELDGFRYKRNSSKYYGKKISEDEASEILTFYKKYSKQFLKIVRKKLVNNRAE